MVPRCPGPMSMVCSSPVLESTRTSGSIRALPLSPPNALAFNCSIICLARCVRSARVLVHKFLCARSATATLFLLDVSLSLSRSLESRNSSLHPDSLRLSSMLVVSMFASLPSYLVLSLSLHLLIVFSLLNFFSFENEFDAQVAATAVGLMLFSPASNKLVS